MTAGIQFVQGFRGNIPYILNFDGKLIDVSDSMVTFNFVDGLEQKRHSINCVCGAPQGNITIPISKKDSTDYGEFYGQFVIKNISGGVDIYPINGYIFVKIQKGV